MRVKTPGADESGASQSVLVLGFGFPSPILLIDIIKAAAQLRGVAVYDFSVMVESFAMPPSPRINACEAEANHHNGDGQSGLDTDTADQPPHHSSDNENSDNVSEPYSFVPIIAHFVFSGLAKTPKAATSGAIRSASLAPIRVMQWPCVTFG